MAANAQPVTNRAEADKVLRMLPLKYPENAVAPVSMPSTEEIPIPK